MNWSGIIYGEPVSKSNSRRLVKFGDRPASIKSKKALGFEADAIKQIKAPAEPITVPVKLTATLYYASQRPDLDESIVMDVLQKAGVLRNDRLIREKHVVHGIDKVLPRAEVLIEPLDAVTKEGRGR